MRSRGVSARLELLVRASGSPENHRREENMKKLLAALFAGLFAISMTAPVVAADKKDEKKSTAKKSEGKKSEAKKSEGKKSGGKKKDEMKK